MTGSDNLEIREFLTADGKNPFREWLQTLDVGPRARIQARVLRFSTGNLGDHKSVGAGVFELRINMGPGLRVYYGEYRKQLVIVLGGGDKATQTRDINRAKRLWQQWLEFSTYAS